MKRISVATLGMLLVVAVATGAMAQTGSTNDTQSGTNTPPPPGQQGTTAQPGTTTPPSMTGQTVTGKVTTIDPATRMVTVEMTAGGSQSYTLDMNSQIMGPGNKKVELSTVKTGDQ